VLNAPEARRRARGAGRRDAVERRRRRRRRRRHSTCPEELMPIDRSAFVRPTELVARQPGSRCDCSPRGPVSSVHRRRRQGPSRHRQHRRFRLRNELCCVGCGVKHYSFSQRRRRHSSTCQSLRSCLQQVLSSSTFTCHRHHV